MLSKALWSAVRKLKTRLGTNFFDSASQLVQVAIWRCRQEMIFAGFNISGLHHNCEQILKLATSAK